MLYRHNQKSESFSLKLDEIQKNIEKISIENWNKSFGGTASSEIANKIEIDNSIGLCCINM